MLGEAMKRDESSCGKELANALSHLRTALELLDAGRAPTHIGAHVDLAICLLSEVTSAVDPQHDLTLDNLKLH